MDPTLSPWTTALAAGGVVAGLTLLAQGLRGYQSSIRVGDTSTSTIRSAAAGEVRISGVVEPAEMTLRSLLQGTPCVYYKSTIARGGDSPADDSVTEERSIGFRVHDPTGSIRVFPRGARIDAAVRFDDETGPMGDEPPGLSMRNGDAIELAKPDRATAIAELLRVRDPGSSPRAWAFHRGDGHRRYREARLEPGDSVTIVGRALPFADLADPVSADLGTEMDHLEADPEIVADLADARAAGTLVTTPAMAWGNAAIPGFGIGRPATAPAIDPSANRLPLASAEQAATAERIFRIDPDVLVLAASAEVPLLIAHGTPGAIVQRTERRYVTGLLGAILAIVSAMALAIMISADPGR